jgi:hypothetical protein
MAKRARGSTTRPGQRRPLQRTTARPVAPTAPVTPRPTSLTAEEEARAAQLEAAIVAEERQAEEAQQRTRTRRTVDEEAARPVSNLTTSADEYAYVARDVRRIALVGGSLVALLFGLWIIAHITGIGPF